MHRYSWFEHSLKNQIPICKHKFCKNLFIDLNQGTTSSNAIKSTGSIANDK